VKTFGFAGWSGSGKTTLIEQLIPRFVRHGRELHIWFVSDDNGFQIVRFKGLNKDSFEESDD